MFCYIGTYISRFTEPLISDALKALLDFSRIFLANRSTQNADLSQNLHLSILKYLENSAPRPIAHLHLYMYVKPKRTRYLIAKYTLARGA